ncbi:hypothetical protein GDO86_004771 [Hymenochirus boettgeri]|uniref:Pre-mRNA cleavage complex 2 protein Pcf11 n=1 Tax=Hymenochirus boettgeri TaxID=247094 RepID=A0A8T2K9L9_9PIPI|nr:hypothetical protein GDO86_004771 [Hymenochirus boettgeri]
MSEVESGREDACRDYQSSLEDLTFNSKPHINMLTILAEENVQFAKDIVILIEAQIAKAPTTEKLPVMYLMDSIVKNVGRDYLAAFSKNLVTTFINVFEKVDENTRKSLYKLRSTWDELFPSKKLFALDVRVNNLDPAWPIKPLPPNVNTASIHVNPKFLNKSEKTPPVAVPTPRTVPPRTSNPDPQKHQSQEQLIRQQLLVKQKQLLELQQKKLELELEQTKAQLENSIGSGAQKPNVTPEISHPPVKVPHPLPSHLEKSKTVPPHPHVKAHEKPQVPIRDPRLNKGSHHLSHGKDQVHKKDLKPSIASVTDSKIVKPLPNDKANAFVKQEKTKLGEKPPKRESLQSELKDRPKSPSPLKAKLPYAKDKSQGTENTRDSEISRRDPRLHKHLRNKTDDKEDEPKEKRKCDKKEEHKSEHRPSGNRNKIVNGTVQKNESTTKYSDKTKPGRNSNRKRSRSPKNRSPAHSPKGRDRRSPITRPRSISPLHALPKIGRLRQPGSKAPHADDILTSSREERTKRNTKTEVRDNRRQKRASEERQNPIGSVPVKSGSEPKDNVESWQGPKANKRWKTGWEENVNSQNEDHQVNRTPFKHRDSWQNNKGIASPRTPKQQHWLSVDADLKIPKELTNASKGELIKKASERFSSGEITHEEFLVVAHQIRQLFQYQEEKQRCTVWDSPTEENKAGIRKKPLLSNADLNYYEHKAKLKKTQVQHSFPGQDLMDPEYLNLELDEMLHSGRESEHGRRQDIAIPERIEDYRRHEEQREFPKGLNEEQRSSFSERFQQQRARYEESEEASYEENVDTRLDRRDSAMETFEDSSNITNIRENSPPMKGCMRFDGVTGNQERERFEAIPGHRVDPHFETMGTKPVDNSRFDGMMGQPGIQRFEGPQTQHLGPDQSIGHKRLGVPQVQPLGAPRFDGPPSQQLGAQRFEGAPGQPIGPQRFDGLQQLGPQRFEGGVGPRRYDGSPRPPLMQPRFEGMQNQPMRFDQPMRFEGQPLGPVRFEGPNGPRFEGNPPLRFDNGPGPQPLMRFDGSMGQVGPRFDGTSVNRFDSQPPHVQRFDLPGQPCQRFDGPPGHQTPPRFDGPMQVQPRFDGPMPQRFDGANQPQRFEPPMGQQGPRFENVHPPVRQNAPNFGQTGHFGDPQNVFHGQPQVLPPQGMPPQGMQPQGMPPQGMLPQGMTTQGLQPQGMPPHGIPPQGMPQQGMAPQGVQPQGIAPQGVQPQGMLHQGVQPQGMPFQRPEQRFDMPHGPNFVGPSGPGVQCFPNQLPRPSGPYFDDKIPNSQGPQFGNFNNISLGNAPPNQPFAPLNGMSQPASVSQPQPAFQDPTYVPPQGPNGGVFVQNQQGGALYPENHLGQLDVNELFSKLLSTGILKAKQAESSSSQASEPSLPPPPPPLEEEEDDPDDDQDVPDLTSFAMEDLKQRYDSVINRIYTGIQCYSCGMRFTKSQTDIYADHLDWHYRQNRTEKDVSRKITHRRWYYSLTDWIEFEEIADLEERAKSQFFEKVHEEVILKTQEAAKEKEFQSVPAGPAGQDEICEICQEQFEQYWDEEEEEWHLKNAMCVNEKIYHPSCYDDYKNTSSFLDSTPSPSKSLLENPLSAMLNLVKEEIRESSDNNIKDEPADNEVSSSCEIPLLTEIKKEPE